MASFQAEKHCENNGDQCPYPLERGARRNESATQLRRIMLEAHMNQTKIVQHPIAWDGLTARLVEEARFPMVFLGGYAVSASHGLADAGYLGFSEMVHRTLEVCRVVDVPVMVDGDTGYGNEVNVRRTVQGYAKAGAAGIMIEDQVSPKRCGHTKDKKVVNFDDAVSRIRAAVAARNEDTDIFILARTDAHIISYEEAIRRAKAFFAEGVDAVAIEAITSVEEMRQSRQDLGPDIPLFINVIEGGKTPALSYNELAAMGYCSVAYPLTMLAAGIKAMRASLSGLQDKEKSPSTIMLFEDVCSAVGFQDYWYLSDKYART
ncbi:Pyruvate/Phosphoenolpyruvate kinase-like domain-containing protein [Dactylonectria macrodidyma]|uniref:Pyruvate/Phosphoenolpyruvate kinase-like domain-containing protein n=1 Tax=Dactylonectria macrodidyma TaxID=307937 RepID=A0A9P9IL29_9HYPO|nr:Pyruvate/Phosphoenolpyruvate kinase-like domain-containing protein [Dactylonectria macrodidyma]